MSTVIDMLTACQLDFNIGDDQSYLMQSGGQISVHTLKEMKERNLKRVEDANRSLAEKIAVN